MVRWSGWRHRASLNLSWIKKLDGMFPAGPEPRRHDRAGRAGGKHDPERTAVRHGDERGSVPLGGRRVPVTRPRPRAADGFAHNGADWIVLMEDGSVAAEGPPEAIFSSMAEPRVQQFLNRVGIP
jgi:hypothetical protein